MSEKFLTITILLDNQLGIVMRLEKLQIAYRLSKNSLEQSMLKGGYSSIKCQVTAARSSWGLGLNEVFAFMGSK